MTSFSQRLPANISDERMREPTMPWGAAYEDTEKDVTIKAEDGVEFMAHSYVLCAISSMLRAQLSPRWQFTDSPVSMKAYEN